MLTINLKGGLGNQMFQYALGRRLSLERNETLALDTTTLHRAQEVGDVYRPFALDAFRIDAHIITPEEAARRKYPYGLLSKGLHLFRLKVLRQTYVGWHPELLKQYRCLYFDGYFQSPKYFEDIRQILLKDFSLVKPFNTTTAQIAAYMGETNSVSVHVRRSDYITNHRARNAQGICSLEYYANAVRKIQESITNPVWFIFSDDIQWVKEELSLPGETIYVSGAGISDQEELLLMSTCKHNIIANSSFSWWGAWLNQNPNKMVIAPTPWFDIRKNEHKDLIPEKWILLPKN